MQVTLLRWSNEDWRDAECWVQQVLRVDLREALEAPELKAKPQIGVSSITLQYVFVPCAFKNKTISYRGCLLAMECSASGSFTGLLQSSKFPIEPRLVKYSCRITTCTKSLKKLLYYPSIDA